MSELSHHGAGLSMTDRPFGMPLGDIDVAALPVTPEPLAKASRFWTPERVALVRIDYDKGLSAAATAEAFGGHVTRSAILGVWRREGFPQRQKATKARQRKARLIAGDAARAELREAYPVASPFLDIPAEAIPPGQRRTIETLTEADCRWPIGDPQHKQFHFCGAAVEGRKPYCAHHSRIAYRPFIEGIDL